MIIIIDPADLALNWGFEGFNRLAPFYVDQLVIAVDRLINLGSLQEGDVAKLVDYLAVETDFDRAVILLPPQAVLLTVNLCLAAKQVFKPINDCLPHNYDLLVFYKADCKI